MILLNGLPPILGATLFHIIFINIFAIIVEYLIIKRRYKGTRLLQRVIVSNLISLFIGIIVIYSIPDSIGGALARPDDYDYSNQDKLALAIRVFFLFLSNVIIETPAYVLGYKIENQFWRLVTIIFIANLVTNIPVLLIYLLFMN